MWDAERPIVWDKQKSDSYKGALNKRVSELATHGTPLYVTGQKAADELLTPEEQESYQEWREQRFLDGVKSIRERREG